MLHTQRATRGMAIAPNALAAQAAVRVLAEGGNAVEAMVAAAATVAVVYPHMNALGGDNFWLISDGRSPPTAIDACGAAAKAADIAFYESKGLNAIPSRGPLAALTVAGAVSGWQQALDTAKAWGGRMSLARLFEDAIHYAKSGVPVTHTLRDNTAAKKGEMTGAPGFAETFMPGGRVPEVGSLLKLPALAATLERLAKAGLDDFYRGGTAKAMAADLGRVGSPLTLADLERHKALVVEPLSVALKSGMVWNLPPPTQGLASLMILGVFERLGVKAAEGFEFVHGLVESTKCAFRVRNRHVTDPAYMTVDSASFLTAKTLDDLAKTVDPKRAAPWPEPAKPGDTVWLGVIDGQGRAVSFIQSLYWEFGSGVVLPETGIVWQNRGTSFQLDPRKQNALAPHRRPFHTIQPAMAKLADGRTMVYGTMGGEGQPQTQAMVYTRHVLFGQELQAAVTAPRWLLGRTWGAEKTNLRIESRFDPGVIAALKAAGHDVEEIGPFDEVMGHAGAITRRPDGLLEGAADPRGDGQAIGY